MDESMTIYSYRCTECSQEYTSSERGDRLDLPNGMGCLTCGHTGQLHRQFSVSIHKPMMAHFNATTQSEVSDMKQFNRKLRQMSDEASEYTGQEHDYQPIDPTDTKAIGVTEEALITPTGTA